MRNQPIRTLLIEDDPDDALLLKQALARSDWQGMGFELERAENLAAGLAVLEEGRTDAVLLDFMLPDSRGLDSVCRVHARFPDVPLVVLTGLQDERLGLEAVTQGAQDYLVKGTVEPHALQRTLCFAVERRRMQQLKAEIKERRRMDKVKDELMSAVSHEMRSPLTIIKAAAINLEDSSLGPLTQDQTMMLNLQRANIERLQKILDRILDLSRLESGRARLQPLRVDAAAAVAETVSSYRLLAAESGIELVLNLPHEPLAVRADPGMFAQVLGNLLENALRFARSRVSVGVEQDADEGAPAGRGDPGGAAVLTERACVRFSVGDDGRGVPEGRLGEVFEKFVQIDRLEGGGYKGTGLGLAICKEIVTRHQGRIWAESAPGAGARFVFTLPRAEDA
ncbi:MAG: hybrid sensor histidine kinase/response regulator [Elusimicrobia bacterium]|nr:hybrid sensor histidine kinase/response regulator [Elusimicrobiota bacterium]